MSLHASALIVGTEKFFPRKIIFDTLDHLTRKLKYRQIVTSDKLGTHVHIRTWAGWRDIPLVMVDTAGLPSKQWVDLALKQGKPEQVIIFGCFRAECYLLRQAALLGIRTRLYERTN